jgi:hypothetical protein
LTSGLIIRWSQVQILAGPPKPLDLTPYKQLAKVVPPVSELATQSTP